MSDYLICNDLFYVTYAYVMYVYLLYNLLPFLNYIEYHNWIVTILIQDAKNGNADGKADNNNPVAEQGDKTVEGQVCDVKVML